MSPDSRPEALRVSDQEYADLKDAARIVRVAAGLTAIGFVIVVAARLIEGPNGM